MSTEQIIEKRKNFEQLEHSSSLPAQKKINLNILNEEDYLSVIEQIIERDFFPDLPKLRLMREYLEAKIIGNSVSANKILFKINCLPPPTKSQENKYDYKKKLQRNEFNTIVPILDDKQKITLSNGKEIEIDLHKGLNDFFNRFISEDNASFAEIKQREEQKKEKLNALLYTNAQNDYITANNKNFLKSIEGENTQMITYTNPNAYSSLSVAPKGVEHQPGIEEYRKGETNITNTRFNSNVLDVLHEMDKSQREKKIRQLQEIQKSNLLDSFVECDEMSTAKNLYSTYDNKQNVLTGLVQTPNLYSQNDTKQSTPMFTWGIVGSTPIPIKEKNPFEIQDLSKREELAQKLYNDQISKKKKLQHSINQMKANTPNSVAMTKQLLSTRSVAMNKLLTKTPVTPNLRYKEEKKN